MILTIRPKACRCCERWTKHMEQIASTLPRKDLTLEKALELFPIFNRCKAAEMPRFRLDKEET